MLRRQISGPNFFGEEFSIEYFHSRERVPQRKGTSQATQAVFPCACRRRGWNSWRPLPDPEMDRLRKFPFNEMSFSVSTGRWFPSPPSHVGVCMSPVTSEERSLQPVRVKQGTAVDLPSNGVKSKISHAGYLTTLPSPRTYIRACISAHLSIRFVPRTSDPMRDLY